MNPAILTLDQIKDLLGQAAQDLKVKLLSAAATTGVEATAEATAAAQVYTLGLQERMAGTLAAFSAGEINLPFLKRRLEDEKLILEGNFDSFEEIGKVGLDGLLGETETALSGILLKIIFPATVTQPTQP